MNQKRRDFLKLTSLTSVGLMGSSIDVQGSVNRLSKPQFNMSGYAAPALETVRIGFIGLGNRGPGAVMRMNQIEGVEIKALCDIRPERVAAMQEKLGESSGQSPLAYSGTEETWKEMCERDDIDLVYIATPWDWHVPMAVYAMEQGKHAAVEVPAAVTLEECWQLVETSEKTRQHCMMLENCCYDFFELMTLNMARQGFFGDIVHAEGAYLHDLLEMNFSKDSYYKMWRLEENFRNGNLYPTHGLGPVCQIMNINRGDQMDYLVSVSSDDFQMAPMAQALASEDAFYESYANKTYRGNMNTTTIRTKRGRTIMLQHDVTSPRPYSRIHLVSGTKGMARKWPAPERIATSHEWMSEEGYQGIKEKYTPEITQRLGEMARKIGGHGGMDFLMDWRLIDCLRNGLPLDQDVYDAALWSAVAPLSEKSVTNRSNSVDVPDFTSGAWQTNEPVDISFRGGGTTQVKS
ncbi:MAG: Gfo/Idh/MocA family oxidoreductase [Bacteroidota bacterium]